SDVGISARWVGGHLCPVGRVTRVGPRILQARVVAELAGLPSRMKDPGPLAGSRVEPANVAFLVAPALGGTARQVGRADDDDVVHDNWRSVEANLARDRIHLLIIFKLHIDDAFLAQRGNGSPRRG